MYDYDALSRVRDPAIAEWLGSIRSGPQLSSLRARTPVPSPGLHSLADRFVTEMAARTIVADTR
jgi:hypothetical protein